MNAVFALCVTSLLVTLACGQVPASVVVRPPTYVSATAGQTVSVTCVGYGNPAVKFTWWKSNGNTFDQVDTSDATITITTSSPSVSGTTYYVSVLQICDLSLSAAGQYSCNASNDASAAPTDTSSAVFSLSVSPDTTVPASIVVQPPTTSMVDVDTIVELVCVAYGNPVPMVSWARRGISNINNDSLPNALVYSDIVWYGDVTFRKSVLQFCPITSRDSGEYTCSATNGISGMGIADPSTTFNVAVILEQVTTSTASTPRPTTSTSETFSTVSETGYQVTVAIFVILVLVMIVVLAVAWIFIFLKKGNPFKSFLVNEDQLSPAINESADDEFTKMKFSDLQTSKGYEDQYTPVK